VGFIAGQFKTPNSLDNLTSSRFGSTFERAAFVNAFGFDRRIGAGVYSEGERYLVSAGVFGETLEEDPLSSGFAVAGRAVVIPIKTDDMLVHLGGSVRYREQEEGDLVRYRERPFAHQFGRILATPAITDSDMFAGMEAAALIENFWLAGEYGMLSGDCEICGEDYNADGKYIEAGYFIGGKRGYKSFAFSRPKIDRSVLDGGPGAFAVLARYDALDLRDEPVDGGELDTVIFGAEWWPISNAKVGLNFFRTKAKLGDVVSGVDDAFAAIIISGATKETVKGVTLRMQLDL
jgi:phosphate-selective porin OprO/OprP